MAKKEITIDDVKSEDISKEIDKGLNQKERPNKHIISKIFTFILLFCTYIFLSVTIQTYTIKIITIFFGFVMLLTLFQIYLAPKYI